MTYDASGNLLNDTFHTYTWHVDGRPLTVDAISLTHDALGRIVEKNNGGVYSQYVYDPGGNKFAIMSGQTLVKGLVPLPGGIQATYDPANSGYRIPDWLGTVRFASNSNRTYSSSEAFAPFGERYSTGGSAPSNYTFTHFYEEHGLISLQCRLCGGEGGIRTLGTGISQYNGLAIHRSDLNRLEKFLL